MHKRILITLSLLGIFLFASAQNQITVEDIWRDYRFITRSVPGFNFLKDGKHYTRLEDDQIKKYDFITGEFVTNIFDARDAGGNLEFNGRIDSYEFSEDESEIIIQTATEYIYRHSTKADFYVWDSKTGTLTTLFKEGKTRYATFSPQGDKVGFFYKNNLYYKDLKSGKVTQVTDDGEYNSIINGGADWVYEEEFSFARAFEWSTDGKKIAFMRFDESRVKEFTIAMHRDEVYPEYVTFKYPKVGEDNAIVNIHIHNTETGKTIKAETGDETNIYFPRIKWTQDPNKLCIYRLNRHQNDIELLLADAATGKTSLLLREKNKYYIDEGVFDNLTFLKDGKRFVWTSEMDGWHHAYLYNMDGKLEKQLTEGDWEITEFYGVDEKKGLIYFQATGDSPMERQVFSINLKGKDMKKLTPLSGWNEAQFSSTFDYYVLNHSDINNPPSFTVLERDGTGIRVLEDNKRMKDIKEQYRWMRMEFFSFKNSDNVDLNGWMIKPPGFSKKKEYPVFMFVYGGPNSQTVVDHWDGRGGLNHWWFQMLAQKGYIVVSVDNRGTGGRGEEFKKMTYMQLGKYETSDLIDAAKYMGDQPYVDAGRIGIFGWSYGGYMSSLCILKGNEHFKAAIAVAPVTNWKWYDTIYTERFMRTLKENEAGYRENSPVYFADRLKGSYLIVHGNGDDNVHFQNTAEMVNALVSANKQFDTYFYPNRNHGIYGGNTRLHLYTKMTNFVLENL